MCILCACRPRTVILLCLAGLAAVLLTGCMRVQRALVINGNGSGTYNLTIGFPEPTPGSSSSISSAIVTPMNAFGAHIQQEGGTYRQFTSHNYVYWTYTAPFSSLAAGNSLLQEDPRQYDQSHTKLLFNDTVNISQVPRSGTTPLYEVTGTISLADPLGNNSSWKDAIESVAIAMEDGVSTHDGGTLAGNTVTYTVGYNQTATIDVTGTGSTATTTGGDNSTQATQARFIAVGVLLALAVILGGVGGWLLRGALKRS